MGWLAMYAILGVYGLWVSLGSRLTLRTEFVWGLFWDLNLMGMALGGIQE